jgi:hypothetical protein
MNMQVKKMRTITRGKVMHSTAALSTIPFSPDFCRSRPGAEFGEGVRCISVLSRNLPAIPALFFSFCGFGGT